MSVNAKLPEGLVDQAKRYAQIQHRSVPKQIEYWSQIGKIAEENPDLPFAMIRDHSARRSGRSCWRIQIQLMRLLVTPSFVRAAKKLHGADLAPEFLLELLNSQRQRAA